MNTNTWYRARSNFNHAWLKNRLIVALSKARKVVEGTVQDDAIWGDLSALLAEWPERKSEAMEVLHDYLEVVSPRNCVESGVGANIGSEAANWLADLSHQRWSESEKPGDRLLNAWGTMAALDTEIGVVAKLLPDAQQRPSSNELANALPELQIAATRLGGAISALGGSRA